jgi:cyclophilin family peptidyl-prolyl cis-trans isomerase
MRKLIPFLALGAIIATGCGARKAESTAPKAQTPTQNVTQQETGMANTGSADEVAVIKTTFGDIVLAFYDQDAPLHVANFKKLAREGFYNGCTFHRVIPGFMIQGGDPNSKDDDRNNDGTGGPGYTIPAEIKRNHKRGALAAARLGDQMNPKRESSGSQFYICVGDAKFLDGAYTVYGEVIKGMDVVDKTVAVPRDARDNPSEKVAMTVEIHKRSEVMGTE